MRVHAPALMQQGDAASLAQQQQRRALAMLTALLPELLSFSLCYLGGVSCGCRKCAEREGVPAQAAACCSALATAHEANEAH
jgi:hypothetical protein